MKELDKVYAEHIAEEYAPKTESKVVALKKLDSKVKRPAKIFAYSFGSVFALMFGAGMSITMGKLGDGSTTMFILGIAVGLFGILGMCLTYPIYNKILTSRKQQYAGDVIALAKSITE